MRAGGCTIQQALTAEAASVVKQAVTLARRRGHAQVTPLHVANTMLAASTGLLRTACLQSHSHPLQCKALELCFNVALNRLPASTSSPMLGSHASQQQHFPSISNALVAAFKRAQAHQRRGSIENQQQPLLAVKIELEQLIISILDDPSVSRVMREAGFSSTQVKTNIEQAVSLEICAQSTTSTKTNKSTKEIISSNVLVGEKAPHTNKPNNISVSLDPIREEDVMCVIENLTMKRRRSLVIIGECVVSLEDVVKRVMEKVQKGEVPEELREVKFITLPVASLGHLSRAEVEQKIEEVKSHVRRYVYKGVVLNLGDLKWAMESSRATGGTTYFCAMEHMMMEIGKLCSGEGNDGRIWVMGIATFQNYMKCKSSHPSLVWGFHPITIPAGSLRLSLITTDHSDDLQSQSTSCNKAENGSSWITLEGGEEKQRLTCCAQCSSKFEIEARTLKNPTTNSDSTTSTLPAWLQKCKNENNGLTPNLPQDCVSITDLCKKWNSICSSVHQSPYSSEKTLTFPCVSPSSSTSYDRHYTTKSYLHQHDNWPVADPWRINQCMTTMDPSLRVYIPEHNNKQALPFSSDPNSTTPNSTSSSDIMEMEYPHKFKELNAENLKTLCGALERKVPWQKEIIPEIASTILQCRSGMVRRKGHARNGEAKSETWLFFQGIDMAAKEKIAKELGRLVFGSSHDNNFISIALSRFSSTKADSSEDCRNKRSRDEQSCSYIERFAEAVSINPHRVFLVEDVEQADYCSQIGFKRAMEMGRVTNSNGEEVGLGDAIIILSCESFSSRSRACSPTIKQTMHDPIPEEEKGSGEGAMEETSPCVSLDLNISFDDNVDDDGREDESIHDIGLLESVDRRIIFKIQEL